MVLIEMGPFFYHRTDWNPEIPEDIDEELQKDYVFPFAVFHQTDLGSFLGTKMIKIFPQVLTLHLGLLLSVLFFGTKVLVGVEMTFKWANYGVNSKSWLNNPSHYAPNVDGFQVWMYNVDYYTIFDVLAHNPLKSTGSLFQKASSSVLPSLRI